MGITITKKVLYREIVDYIMIAIGCISYSIGWTIFLLPNNISTGGVQVCRLFCFGHGALRCLLPTSL